MFQTSNSRATALSIVSIVLLGFLLTTLRVNGNAQTSNQSTIDPVVASLIHRQKYNEALTRLEQILERDPNNAEAITYMVTANLYQGLNFQQAKTDFEEAFKGGGGATFFVTHSHEVFSTGDVVDYCRGWLHFRKGSVEFVPIEGTHSLKLQPAQIEEFKRNRLSKKVFHIKVGGKSQNFRGRSNTELEPLLIIALYKSFTGN